MVIQRITSFKVPNEADIQPFLDQYTILERDNKKDGKPYILETKAFSTINDPRSQGYTLVALTKFESLEHMKYYDEECEAHKKLKAFAKDKVAAPPLTVYGNA